MAKTMYQATGRRKSSVARVRLLPGAGNIIINKRDIDTYFGEKDIVKNEVRRPLERTKSEDLSNLQAHSEALMLSLPLTAAVSQARQEHSDTESQEHSAKSMKRLTDLHSRQPVS